jgi:tetratricopeptide (TPR) repeat protein
MMPGAILPGSGGAADAAASTAPAVIMRRGILPACGAAAATAAALAVRMPGTMLACQPDPAALVPLYRQAVEEREKEFGPEHPKVAAAARDLGLFLRNHGDKPGAAAALRRALEIDLKVLGADSRTAGEDFEHLASVLPAAEAMPLYREAAKNKDPALAARSLARLAAFEESQGRRKEALQLYRQALGKEEAVSGTGARVAVRLNDVALLESPETAEPLLRRALAIQEKALPAKHPETAATLNNLANVLLARGRAAAAEPLARRALAALEETLGPRHPRVATAASNLADILRARKSYAAARRYYEQALAVDEQAYGPSHPEVAADLRNLAGLLEESGNRSGAEALRRRADAISEAK